MDGENKNYLEEEQLNINNIDDQNQKALGKISAIKETMDKFFENISNQEL